MALLPRNLVVRADITDGALRASLSGWCDSVQHMYVCDLISSREMGLDGVTLLIERELVQSCVIRHQARVASTRAELLTAVDDISDMVNRGQDVSTLIDNARQRRDAAEGDEDGGGQESDDEGESDDAGMSHSSESDSDVLISDL